MDSFSFREHFWELPPLQVGPVPLWTSFVLHAWHVKRQNCSDVLWWLMYMYCFNFRPVIFVADFCKCWWILFLLCGEDLTVRPSLFNLGCCQEFIVKCKNIKYYLCWCLWKSESCYLLVKRLSDTLHRAVLCSKG